MAITGITSVSSLITQSLSDMRAQLDDLQRQLGSGQKSDTYSGLGPQRSLAVGLQAQLDATTGFDNTITLVGTRLDLAQTSLTTIGQTAQDVKHAVSQPNFTLGQGGQTVDQQAAQGQLDQILSALNAQDGSGYIFSGMSPDQQSVDTLDHILNGNGSAAGLKQIISERLQADQGTAGLGRLDIPAVLGGLVTVNEDGSPFGFKLAGVNSTLTGATTTGPSGVPPSMTVNFSSNPNAGESITLALTLPDGSAENVTLTATNSNPPGANQFTIGATNTDTADNFQIALTAAVAKLNNTSLVAASAMEAANNFFDTDAANPPQRVAGPPFDTATALVAGTSTDTVTWYTGEAGASPARGTAIARIDPSATISYGLRANEDALRTVVKSVATFAAMSFSSSDPNASAQYTALTTRLSTNFTPTQGQQSVQGIQTELANAQTLANDASDRHKQTSSTLTDLLQSIENVSPEDVGTQLLALQTALQASLQTTAMLSKLSLVNYIS